MAWVRALAVLGLVAPFACGGSGGGPSPAPKPDAGVALCIDGKPTSAYPPGPYELGVSSTAPTATFESPDGPLRLESFYEPCAERSRLLVVRSSAAWCGPCQWQAAHTKRFAEDPRFAGRLVLLDLLVADEDNVPATLATLPSWRAKIDAPAILAIDPRFTFGPALLARGPLPEYVFIDTRTMKITSTLSDPDPESLLARIELELAELDDLPRPGPISPNLVDGHFTENEFDLIRGMRLVPAPPPDPTNEYGDVAAAAAFGRDLFSDPLLSPASVACVKCHVPGQDFTDGAAQSLGIAKVDRNAPPIALASHARWQFWDGRADTLWMQALLPFEDPKEIGSSRLYIAHQIAQRHAAAYDAVFGAKYPLPDLAALPAQGKPGDPAYDALSEVDKDKATRIFVNVGKAIAAFERLLRVEPNALDRYIDGDLTALTRDQKHSLMLFFQSGCAQCHWGPRLTDDAFHVLRFETGRQDRAPDPGRADGLVALSRAEFRASTKWSDAPSLVKAFDVDTPGMLGAFKTPTLRGLPTSAPYGHGGTLATLADVSKHYGERGLDHADPRSIGTTEQWVPLFDANVRQELPMFLDVLTGHVLP